MAPPTTTTGDESGATLERPPLREASAADVPRLARVLAEAFEDDPVFEWLLPVDARRCARLERYFEIELQAVGLAHGSVWTTGDLAGAAISTPPGKWRLPLFTTLRHGPRFTRAFGVRLPRALGLLQRVEARHVRDPHHYFPAIGVAPERQGQGLGSRLMAPTLDRCDEAGLPAYLEASSERSAALYARLGFELIQELHYGGSQPLRLMLRAPVPAAADDAAR